MEYVYDLETGEITELPDQPDDPAKRETWAWEFLRADRNARLAASDWTVMSDTPTATAAWKTYRQALRDLPANTTDPFNPVWPTPPA